MKNQDQKMKKRLMMGVLFAGIFAILVLVAVLFAIIESGKSVTLNILVAPQDAEILLNGSKYKNGSYRVEPGEYEIKITHAELEPYDEVRWFGEGETVDLYLYLTGPDGDMSWYLTHNADDMIVTGIGDYYANLESQAYAASDPVFMITPYYDYNNGFKVNAMKKTDDEKNEIIVYLYTCDKGRVDILKANANKWLDEQELNLENYTLTYKYCDE